MANADKLLARMRASPLDWQIADVVALCHGFGVDCTPPRNGSHYKVKHRTVTTILTIPAHRPIKPVYIRELVRFIDVVQESGA